MILILKVLISLKLLLQSYSHLGKHHPNHPSVQLDRKYQVLHSFPSIQFLIYQNPKCKEAN